MTSIEHKDGATVLDGWTYGMGGGAITSITADDGSRWAYEHDANSRLTKAERYDTDGTTLLHRYSYTYDDGDNLITKAVLDAVASVTTATAFAYNDANELVSQAVGGTTTSFAYDAWGRMTSKSDGTYSATYAYRYGNKLASVTSDFPSEGNATYQYDGAGKRRQRTAGGATTRYRWDEGWTVMNEEDSLGDLTRTYVGRGTAHVDGSNPSTGTWRFYVHDHLGSTRGVYNADKTQYAAFEPTPYGEVYASTGSVSDITRGYTGHDWDDAAELYYAPHRYYAPGLARWITRDPLGMVDGPNIYAYAQNSPINAMVVPDRCGNDLTEEVIRMCAKSIRDGVLLLSMLALSACMSTPHSSPSSRAVQDGQALLGCLGHYLRACEMRRVDSNGERIEPLRFQIEDRDKLDPYAGAIVDRALARFAALDAAVDDSLDPCLIRKLSEDHSRVCQLFGIEEDSFLDVRVDVNKIRIVYPADCADTGSPNEGHAIHVNNVSGWNSRWTGRKRAFQVRADFSGEGSQPQAYIAFEIRFRPCVGPSLKAAAGPNSSMFRQARRLHLSRQEDGKWRAIADEH